MGAIRLRERVADLCKRFDLIFAWNPLRDRYWLLSQPSADCCKIIFCQVIEIDSANRAQCVAILDIFGKLVRVGKDESVGRSFGQPEEWCDLGVGQVGTLRSKFDLIRNERSGPCTKYAIDALSIILAGSA